jgi:hypothetical protein
MTRWAKSGHYDFPNYSRRNKDRGYCEAGGAMTENPQTLTALFFSVRLSIRAIPVVWMKTGKHA